MFPMRSHGAMPDIRPEEISLATCDGAGWSVGLSCLPCRTLFPIQLAPLRRHKLFRRPLVWLPQESRPVFRCKRCGSPASGIYVSRPGDGQVCSVDLLDKKARERLRNA